MPLHGTLKSKHRNHEYLHSNSPVLKCYELIHNKLELWHYSRMPILEWLDGKEPVRAEPGSFRIPEGEMLNANVLSCFDIGLKRVREYFQKHYIDSLYSIGQSEKDVPLTKILATGLEQKQEMKRWIDRASSTDADDLDKVFNATEAGECLGMTIEMINDFGLMQPGIPPPKLYKMSKKVVI